MAAPEKQTMNLQQISDRTSFQRGATRLSDPSHIKIWYNAELADPSCFAKYAQCLLHGVVFDKERSYMYLREGALETNQSYNCCIKCLACLKPPDCVCVSYFDKRPWKKYKCTCCGICSGDPSIEKVDNAYLICLPEGHLPPGVRRRGLHVVRAPRQVLLLLPQQGELVCNTCGLCGSPDGNPLIHLPFAMQPKDVEGFVAQAKQVIPAARAMHP